MVPHLPKSLKLSFHVMLLVDTAFVSVEFIHGIRAPKIPCDYGCSR